MGGRAMRHRCQQKLRHDNDNDKRTDSDACSTVYVYVLQLEGVGGEWPGKYSKNIRMNIDKAITF